MHVPVCSCMSKSEDDLGCHFFDKESNWPGILIGLNWLARESPGSLGWMSLIFWKFPEAWHVFHDPSELKAFASVISRFQICRLVLTDFGSAGLHTFSKPGPMLKEELLLRTLFAGQRESQRLN